MIETFKKSALITSCVYIFIYLFASFTMWEFRNPFQWIIDIPTYASIDRFLIFFFIILWWAFVITTSTASIDKDEQ